GGATAKLMWSSNRQKKEIVPASALAASGAEVMAMSTIPPMEQALGAVVHNVRAYGAVGDGVTDDRAAIQAAIDAAIKEGGQLYFPQGVYRVSQYLQIKGATDLEVIGQNATLRAMDSAPLT